jgi:2-keto-myo-inositol isomerase
MKFHFGDNSRILRRIAALPHRAAPPRCQAPALSLPQRGRDILRDSSNIHHFILANFGINVLTVSQLNEPTLFRQECPMAIAMQRFCINRKIAPALSIEAFFRLVNRLGLNKVELRNDLPSGKVTDDLSHQQVRELAARYHIEILTINAVYPLTAVAKRCGS